MITIHANNLILIIHAYIINFCMIIFNVQQCVLVHSTEFAISLEENN